MICEIKLNKSSKDFYYHSSITPCPYNSCGAGSSSCLYFCQHNMRGELFCLEKDGEYESEEKFDKIWYDSEEEIYFVKIVCELEETEKIKKLLKEF